MNDKLSDMMLKKFCYKLNEDKSVSLCTVIEWSNQYEEMFKNKTKHVAQDIVNGKKVSTVWIGIDHQWQENKPPLIFETMVFENKNSGEDIYCNRYSTWQEAEAGHQKAIEWVKNGCKDDE